MRASKYSPEFRERAVRLARESERPISAVAHDLGVHPETLRVWVRQDEANDGSRSDRLTTAEREELTALYSQAKKPRFHTSAKPSPPSTLPAPFSNA